MKRSNWLWLLILLVNFFVSCLVGGINNFLWVIFIETMIWLLLGIIYYFFGGNRDRESLVKYCFYYLVDIGLLNILFVIFNIDFILIKVINLFVVGILSFIELEINKLKKINIYLLLFNIVFFFLLSSSMVPIGKRNSTIDYSVFRYIGLLMDKGKVPYRDVFDHKGLLLYFINYLGVVIDKEIGIWIVEFIFLYLSIVIIYKITKLFTEKLNLLSTMIVFSSLILTYNGAGNSVEQYGIFFILVGMYLFYRDIKNKDVVSVRSGFLIGMSLGAVLMLRPNMIAVYVCMAIYLLIVYLKKKKYRELLQLIGVFLLGILIFILPCIGYLFINGAMDDFIYQYLIFNFSYSGANEVNNLFKVIIFFLLNCKLIWVSIIIIIFLLVNKKNRGNLYLSLAMIILSFILVVSPCNEYSHYAIVMIPTFIYPISIFCECVYNCLNKYLDSICVVKFIMVLFTCMLFMGEFISLILTINMNLTEENEFVELEKIIEKDTTIEDNILVFGNRVNVYLKTNRFTYLKYPYQIPAISIDDKLKNDFRKEVKSNLPKMIIVFDDVLDDMIFLDNGVNDDLFLECFGEVLDNYKYYYEGEDYYIYKLRDV